MHEERISLSKKMSSTDISGEIDREPSGYGVDRERALHVRVFLTAYSTYFTTKTIHSILLPKNASTC